MGGDYILSVFLVILWSVIVATIFWLLWYLPRTYKSRTEKIPGRRDDLCHSKKELAPATPTPPVNLRVMAARNVPKSPSNGYDRPEWVLHQLRSAYMNRFVLVVDCETTGLSNSDRIVSLGLVVLQHGKLFGNPIYLVFNPEIKSHPRARRVHGFSEKVLAVQPLFANYANQLYSIIGKADLIVAHNAVFDIRFIMHELSLCNLSFEKPLAVYCTMRVYEALYPGQPKSLLAASCALGLDKKWETEQVINDVYTIVGEKPPITVHSAIEDAVTAAKLFQALNGMEISLTLPLPKLPTNYVKPVRKSKRSVEARLGNSG